jgi:DNA adenine methylase
MIDVPLAMAGSKRKVIDRLWPNIPRPASGRIIVPFFGTGADSVFFSRQGLDVLGSDVNPDLTGLHNEIEDAFRTAARWNYGRDRDQYLELRDAFNRERESWMFLILLRLGWNKIVRYNRAGRFNVPPGDLPARFLPSAEVVLAFADVVERIGGVSTWDFDHALDHARPGDVAYLDPPYFGTFDYGLGFDHERLFDRLAWLEIPWAMSNSSNLDWSEVFPGARVIEVERAGTINSDPLNRGRVREVLVCSE